MGDCEGRIKQHQGAQVDGILAIAIGLAPPLTFTKPEAPRYIWNINLV